MKLDSKYRKALLLLTMELDALFEDSGDNDEVLDSGELALAMSDRVLGLVELGMLGRTGAPFCKDVYRLLAELFSDLERRELPQASIH